MTIHIGRNHGIHLKRTKDMLGKGWIYGVIWYHRPNGMLGYWYPSFRWF